MNDNEEKIIEVAFHGRGGQTAITASQLLAKMFYYFVLYVLGKNFADVIDIPIIGAERRGAPIMAFTKMSYEKKIKTYETVKNPDYIFIFDTSLLNIPKVKETIKKGVTLIINTTEKINKSDFPENIKFYIVDATGICIKRKFMHSSGPILNIPMLGAFGKITGFYNLETMEKVLKKEFGEDGTKIYGVEQKLKKNMDVAEDAYNTVIEI